MQDNEAINAIYRMLVELYMFRDKLTERRISLLVRIRHLVPLHVSFGFEFCFSLRLILSDGLM